MRRHVLAGLLGTAALAFLVWLGRRGMPGARRLVLRLAPRPTPVQVEYYGYQEVHTS